PQLTHPARILPDINDGVQMSIVPKMRVASRFYPDKPHFKWFATDGQEGNPPEYLSYGFPYSGCAVMRTDWGRDAVWAYMDCSPFGRGHQHEDKLNVLLDAYGKTLLTEGGVYDYDSSEMRKYVLSTRAHNTAMLNGKEQNQRLSYKWADEDIAKKADFLFETTSERDIAAAEYTAGYGADREPLVHSRRLTFVKNAPEYGLLPFFIVSDRFTAEDDAARKYEIMWHMETCELKLEGAYASGDFGDGIGLTMAASDAEYINMQGQYQPYYQGWFPIRPSGPHEHRPIPTPVLCGEFCGSKRVVTVLYPYKDGEDPISAVKASADITENSVTLVLKDGREIALTE
ncbi:MAG: heparinase II/III-family protein, partial [Clostridia bacterium]|nr:heparinase II/III-family protein [Clostridia bacterium]